MQRYLIYIELEDYLKEWFIAEQGGNNPVKLQKGCVESDILKLFLTKLPANTLPEIADDTKLAIEIPSFKFRPPEVYNYLPKDARNALINCIRNRFDVTMWNDLHRFGYIGRQQQDIIYAWMYKYNIEPTEKNWNAIAKRYQRKRNYYLTLQRNLKKSTKIVQNSASKIS